jgi:hypothetical protein
MLPPVPVPGGLTGGIRKMLIPDNATNGSRIDAQCSFHTLTGRIRVQKSG